MNNTQRISALESDVSEVKAMLTTLLTRLDAGAPAKVTRPKAEPKPRKAAQPKAVRHLCRKNRQDFVKAHAWAKGLSTQVIAAMCVEDPSLLSAGWGIGERYTEMFSA